jgi:signal transduction histidine kinase
VSEELGRLAQRLRELADQLRDPSLDDERVEALAREAADLAAQAGTESEAALRDSAGEADE